MDAAVTTRATSSFGKARRTGAGWLRRWRNNVCVRAATKPTANGGAAEPAATSAPATASSTPAAAFRFASRATSHARTEPGAAAWSDCFVPHQ